LLVVGHWKKNAAGNASRQAQGHGEDEVT